MDGEDLTRYWIGSPASEGKIVNAVYATMAIGRLALRIAHC